MIFKVLILASLIKLLINTEKPMLCAGIYTAAVFLLGLMFHGPSADLILASGIALALSAIYFFVLQRFSDSTLFWVFAALGIVIGFV